MMRFSAVVVSLLVLGCASTQNDAFVVHDSIQPETPYFAAEAPAGDFLDPAADPAAFTHALATTLPAPAAAEGLRHSRFTVKAGYYGSEEDELDDGYIINLSWMRFFSSLFALELEAGYFDADGNVSGVDTEAWGIPLMVNGRVNLPIWILDVYGGLGIGTIYYDAEASALGVSATDDGFVAAGNAFLGATLNLADAIAMGIEAKYYGTGDMADFDTSLDALAVMLTLGFSR